MSLDDADEKIALLDADEKLALLKEIRDEVRKWSGDTQRGLDGLSGDIHGPLGKVDRGLDRTDRLLDRVDRKLDRMDGQFDRIEAALADYAEQVRLTVHYVTVLCKQRGIEIEPA